MSCKDKMAFGCLSLGLLFPSGLHRAVTDKEEPRVGNLFKNKGAGIDERVDALGKPRKVPIKPT